MNLHTPPGLVSSITPVGSRVTCRPAPTDTDADYLVLTTDHYTLREVLLGLGWGIGGSRLLDSMAPLNEVDRFSSYTKGDDNLIVTSDPVFHRRFLAATSVAKRLNLISKSDRIALFQAVLYGNYPEETT